VLVSYPLDVIFTRQAGQLCVGEACAASQNLVQTARALFASGGLGSLYAGAGFTLVSSLPYEGIKFGTFDLLKQRLCPPGTSDGHKVLLSLLAGAGAGAASHSATYPLDTIRRNLQMRGGLPRVGKSGAKVGTLGSAVVCARDIYAKGGLMAFYKGLPITIVRTLPNTGLQFFFYEAIKRVLEIDSEAPERAKAARKQVRTAVTEPLPAPSAALACASTHHSSHG